MNDEQQFYFTTGMHQPPVNWELIRYLMTHDVRLVGYVNCETKGGNKQ
jgi:hypothetical protein